MLLIPPPEVQVVADGLQIAHCRYVAAEGQGVELQWGTPIDAYTGSVAAAPNDGRVAIRVRPGATADIYALKGYDAGTDEEEGSGTITTRVRYIPADMDFSGTHDTQDLLIFLDLYRNGFDFNADGESDPYDLLQFLQQFKDQGGPGEGGP